ncbi:MAG: hypothetical protein LBV69_09470, partial [Bacteroidales bacterium]|nr:hypothetical protein [Bacteroidales bacterium]
MQTNIVFSQFLGGGTGTASDPYRIYNIQHLEILRDSMAAHGGFWNNYSYLTGKHLRLMNDITDSLTFIISDYNTPLNAFFHGGGHFINCKILNNINSNPNAIFGRVSSYATIDSLALYGVIYLMKGFTLINDGLISNCINNVPLIGLNGTNLNDEVFGICHQNVGTLLNCVNNADIITTQGAGICQSNSGSMINCINNGNIMGIVQNDIVDVAGLCFALNFENASISNCINNGNITISGIAPYSVIGGLVCRDYGGGLANINNSVNTGNIDAKSCYTNGGIIGMGSANVTNCANYGNITNSQYAGGIFGTNGDAINGHSIVIIENCFNSGEINGINNSGGLVGRIDPIENSHLNNCVNIGKVNNTGFALFGNQTNAIYGSPYLTISNNYYDKQMVTKPATVIGDIPGQAEGKLTTQLTGIGTELQAMLGNGWSYAEGRYPIPLGLENDSAAILAATPMYLHFTDTVNFNTVDSVSQDFTVGMENNVAWQV